MGQTLIDLLRRGIPRTGDESLGRSNEGPDPDLTDSGGYQPSLFPQEVCITYLGLSVPPGLRKCD